MKNTLISLLVNTVFCCNIMECFYVLTDCFGYRKKATLWEYNVLCAKMEMK